MEVTYKFIHFQNSGLRLAKFYK